MPRWLPPSAILAAVALPAATVQVGWAAEYLSFDAAMRLAFPTSGKVERFRPVQGPDQGNASLGGIYVGHSGGMIDAVAYVDNVIGRTEYITYLCVIDGDGRIRRLEVMTYREPLGGEIRERRWLDQFTGKGADDPLLRGRDIANIGGATLSVQALTARVRFLLDYQHALRPQVIAWLRDRVSPAPRPADGPPRVERAAAIGAAAFSVRVHHDGGAPGRQAAEAAAEAAVALATRLDGELNAWRPDAELARLNAAGAASVGRDLFAAVVQAQALWTRTGGRFDPTVLPLLLEWRQAAADGVLPSPERLAAARARVGFGRVRLDPATGGIDLGGTALDLGGINKGRILDLCGAALAAALPEGQTAALSHGESSWLAVGRGAGRDDLQPVVLLRHPGDPRRLHQRVRLRPGQGLGSSSTAGQTFRIGGEDYSHIIDPLTGRPAALRRAATVIAPSAAEADGLDNTLCLMPVDQALALLAQWPGIEAQLWDGERFHQTPGWPGEALPP